VGSGLCSAVSTSVVAASVVGVLDVFTLEVEEDASPVRRGSILGGLEHLRGGWGWELRHCRGDGRVLDVFTPEVEVGASPIRQGSVLGSLERLGGMVLSRRRAGRVSNVQRGGIFDDLGHLGGGVLSFLLPPRRGRCF
jgi:hypothetical protein